MQLTIDVKGLEEVQELFKYLKDDAPRAMMRSINKTLNGARTDMTQAIYDQYNVTKTKIRKTFSIKKAGIAKLTGKVGTTGDYLNLIEFSARQTQKGVTVKILRNGSRKSFPGAFIRTINSGKKLVLQREYHKKKKAIRPGFPYGSMPRKYRLPVTALSGPRLQDHLEKPEILTVIERKATERLVKAAGHEADYLLKQRLESGDGFNDV